MSFEEKTIIRRVAEHYLLTGLSEDAEVSVICLPKNKTSTLEQSDGASRSIMLDEFEVSGKKIWCAYSSRSKTVYLSPAGY